MLKEKALNDEDITVTDDDGVIVRIPAKQALSELPPLPDPPECLKDLDYSGY